MSDAVVKAYEARCTKAEATISVLREAVNFYANHNHWMLPSESSPYQMLLIAHGNTASFDASKDGWSMAEWALRRTRAL